MSSEDQALPAEDYTNWVDPDIIEYYEETGSEMPAFDPESEREFMEFFKTGWHDPKYDDLRERWNPWITPPGAGYGKTALWSLIKLREIKERMKGQNG